MPLWEELSTLVTIMLLGHCGEMRSIVQAQGALKELAKLLPDTAVRIVGEQMEEVPISGLRERDVVRTRSQKESSEAPKSASWPFHQRKLSKPFLEKA